MTFSLTRPSVLPGVEHSGRAQLVSGCLVLFFGPLADNSPFFFFFFAIAYHTVQCMWVIFSMQNLNLTPVLSFLKITSWLTLIQNFGFYKFFSHTFKKRENMCITLGFTAVKGLSTDTAYRFYQFNPNRAKFFFISNSTPQYAPRPHITFPGRGIFLLFLCNCVTCMNYLNPILPFSLSVK